MSDLILQLTDLHLFADPAERMRGVPPHACLLDVLDHIRASNLDPALVVLSGDLAHDEQRATYGLLHDLLAEWLDRLLIIPGNHDHCPSIRAVFPQQFRDSRCPDPWVTFSRTIGDWLILGLDSHVPGQITGHVADEQLTWLDKELARHPNSPTMLFLHHPPISIHSPWLDRLGLTRPEALLKRIASHDQIALLVTGHVHQDFTGTIADTPLLTTPSTAMQFTPGTATPEYDPIPSGYRVVEIEGTEWSTRVVRLPELRFPPAEDDT